MVKTKQTMIAQLIVRAVILLLLLLGLLIVVPGLRYLFMLFIIVNFVLGFINGRRDLPVNITFIILTPLLFIPILEYLITIILVILTGIHLVRFWLWYRDGGKEKKRKSYNDNNKIEEKLKIKEKMERGFIWYGLRASFGVMILLLLVNIIAMGSVPLIIALVILIFFTLVVSIVHLVKYKNKAFAIVSLIISSLLILLMIIALLAAGMSSGVSMG